MNTNSSAPTLCVTIDGPAGSGKSTVAKLLAKELSGNSPIVFEYLDTGSMYRSIALLGLRRGIDWEIPEQLEALARIAKIDIEAGRTVLNGEDVTELVRSPEVTEKTRFAANNPAIRFIMVDGQQDIGRRFFQAGKGLVTEGRDQGTVVFPDAGCKIYLNATPEERARRRCGELEKRGETPDFEEILQGITRRDDQDAAREVGPMRKPEDSVEIFTDKMDIPAVVQKLSRIVREKLLF